MFTKTLKQTGYAILATATLSISSASLTTTAQAASLDLNPIPTTQVISNNALIEVRSGHGFHTQNRGLKSSKLNHSSKFKSKNRKFKKGHFKHGHSSFKSRRAAQHDGFNYAHGILAYKYSPNGRTK